MSTLTIKKRLQKLAADPWRSWQRFKQGLVLFALGAASLIFIPSIWVQYLALLVLTAGFLWAGCGYLGILVYRLSNLKVGK